MRANIKKITLGDVESFIELSLTESYPSIARRNDTKFANIDRKRTFMKGKFDEKEISRFLLWVFHTKNFLRVLARPTEPIFLRFQISFSFQLIILS